jgi:hypothetical protein
MFSREMVAIVVALMVLPAAAGRADTLNDSCSVIILTLCQGFCYSRICGNCC